MMKTQFKLNKVYGRHAAVPFPPKYTHTHTHTHTHTLHLPLPKALYVGTLNQEYIGPALTFGNTRVHKSQNLESI